MELKDYSDALRGELAAITRFANDEVARAGQMLAEALDSSVQLALLDVLSAAAAEITSELDDVVVEVRLAGGEPTFVVNHTQHEPPAEPEAPAEAAGDESGSARITFRLPDALKGRIEAAAAAQHLSVNTWLVRAASQALDTPAGPPRPPFSRRGPGQRITGYARS
jgi:predicted HicB family RNase H-like nuclease